MDVEVVGLIGIIVMFALMLLRVPIAIAMSVPAFIGIVYLKGGGTLSTVLTSIVWDHSFSYTLTTIPLFVLMGNFLYSSGISDELFDLFRKWFGRIRGGLAMATIGASSSFATISGSSLATTGIIGVIASRSMSNAGYSPRISSGAICAGGTLGILIPPSTGFLLYGILTEQSIGKLFISGIIPGIILTVMYMITIYIWSYVRPQDVPLKRESYSWKEKILAIKPTFWIFALFLLVIGGMYMGWFTPTESAGVGAFGAFLISMLRGRMNYRQFKESMDGTIRMTGFLFAIILSAFILNYFLAITRIPLHLANFITGLDLPVYVIFALVVLLYVILGAVMDAMAMIVITIPIIVPAIQAMGFDLIWFGVIIVIVIEMAFITPPVGMNCFVLNGAVPSYKLEEIFKGSIVFVIPLLMLIVLLAVFPELALFLPNSM